MYFDSRDTTDFFQRACFLTTAARNPNNWGRTLIWKSATLPPNWASRQANMC